MRQMMSRTNFMHCFWEIFKIQSLLWDKVQLELLPISWRPMVRIHSQVVHNWFIVSSPKSVFYKFIPSCDLLVQLYHFDFLDFLGIEGHQLTWFGPRWNEAALSSTCVLSQSVSMILRFSWFLGCRVIRNQRRSSRHWKATWKHGKVHRIR